VGVLGTVSASAGSKRRDKVDKIAAVADIIVVGVLVGCS